MMLFSMMKHLKSQKRSDASATLWYIVTKSEVGEKLHIDEIN